MDKIHNRFATKSLSPAMLISLVALLLITIGVISNQRRNSIVDKHITISKKDLLDICHGLDFGDTCAQNLPFKLFGDHKPGEIMQMGMEAAMDDLREAAKKAIALQAEHSDEHTKNALKQCSQLADKAINDLQRSLQDFIDHGIQSLGDILDDLQVWLSGALTYQQTCLDGLSDNDGNPVGPVHENMKEALTKGMELTTNALGMTTTLNSKFGSSGDSSADQKSTPANRRLKLLETFPEWLDPRRRALIDGAPAASAAAPTSPGNVKADVIVAQDGSGKYKTINEALKDIPQNSDKQFIMYIKAGVYKEKVVFTLAHKNVMLIGDGPANTKITGALNVQDGQTTFMSATVAVEGDLFSAKDIGFENSAGAAKGQAVALRAGADKLIFHNCHVDGYQDTLYTHTYRQFYRNCVISGTVDFVFGDAAVVFQNCTFLIRKPGAGQGGSVMMAQSRINIRQPTGVVIQNSTIVEDPAAGPDKATGTAFLGRPWTEFSRTIIMESFISDIINPEGYTPWKGTFGVNTSYYAEFGNRGPGAPTDKRLKWPGIKQLTVAESERFTPNKFIQSDTWVPPAKIPYVGGFTSPPGPGAASTAASAPGPGNEDIPFQNQRNCYNVKAQFNGSTCV